MVRIRENRYTPKYNLNDKQFIFENLCASFEDKFSDKLSVKVK